MRLRRRSRGHRRGREGQPDQEPVDGRVDGDRGDGGPRHGLRGLLHGFMLDIDRFPAAEAGVHVPLMDVAEGVLELRQRDVHGLRVPRLQHAGRVAAQQPHVLQQLAAQRVRHKHGALLQVLPRAVHLPLQLVDDGVAVLRNGALAGLGGPWMMRGLKASALVLLSAKRCWRAHQTRWRTTHVLGSRNARSRVCELRNSRLWPLIIAVYKS